MKSKDMAYLKNAGIRAGRTFVQAFVAVMIANQANLFEADVIMAALVAGASAVVSVLQNALEDAPFAFMSKDSERLRLRYKSTEEVRNGLVMAAQVSPNSSGIITQLKITEDHPFVFCKIAMENQ